MKKTVDIGVFFPNNYPAIAFQVFVLKNPGVKNATKASIAKKPTKK
ncbi:MAG: hypothetical protein IPP49_02735 [Saprospiraceae bacterium]|nr:hypothetical protein [Saprospiraceae bacterium]